MAKHHQAFFHSSDAYSLIDIGKRYTWLKLASPRIESLRQAFVADDSRLRIAYSRAQNGELVELQNPPDVALGQRTWLKSMTVEGGASFFGSTTADPVTRFDFSPDLTCIIGGSMTGKSTLLDGLRIHLGGPLPQDASVRKQVEARGRQRLLAGSAIVNMDCPGADPTAQPIERWPAVFFAQSELQRLGQDPNAIEEILSRLVESETEAIEKRGMRLTRLDQKLAAAACGYKTLIENLGEAEQALQRSTDAAANLETFADAGVDALNKVTSHLERSNRLFNSIDGFVSKVSNLLIELDTIRPFRIGDEVSDATERAKIDASGETLFDRWCKTKTELEQTKSEAKAAKGAAKEMSEILKDVERTLRAEVERKLAAHGISGDQISQIQMLNSQAALEKVRRDSLESIEGEIRADRIAFDKSMRERADQVRLQRDAFDRVIESINSQFCGRLSVSRIDDGQFDALTAFVKGLNHSGVTRWWNDLQEDRRPSPELLIESLESENLVEVGMSAAVQNSFRSQLTQAKKRELSAVRCRDRYVIELRLPDGTMREMGRLSGGQRVSVLLTLLLETKDDRPLVIDQPEDELDNRFLFDTLLPALKRLKGQRQIIVATHNPNIVVNGDADHVMLLEATAERGAVAVAGAIEEPEVRDAIVQTVDGGGAAFQLRHTKYGF